MEHIFKYFLADKWEVENRKLNNYVHSNGKKYLTDNYVHPGKTEKDKELIETMNNIVDIFLKLVIIYLGGILKWQEQKKTVKH